MGLYYPPGHRKTKAGPPRAAGPVRSEDCVQSFLLNAWAVVLNLNLDKSILGGQNQLQIRPFFSIQHLDCVQHQIQKGLFEQ